jgi:beta-alanine--pyruvate transaminase
MAATQNLEPYWMPFTGNRYFKSHPMMMASAEGMYYTTTEGHKILDGISGLWCCNAGHCHPKIVTAIQTQAASLDYATAFQMGHPGVFELAEQLTDMAPGNLD